MLQFPGKLRTVTMKIACVLTCSCMSRSCFFATISKMNSVLKAPVAKLIKINKCKGDTTRKSARSLGYFHRHLKSDDTERHSPFELHSSWLFVYDLMYNLNFPRVNRRKRIVYTGSSNGMMCGRSMSLLTRTVIRKNIKYLVTQENLKSLRKLNR